MTGYIKREDYFCKEIDKGDLLVGNNTEWAKEIAQRTPDADVVPKSEVARDIFAEIDRMCIDPFGNFNHRVFVELKKKYIQE